MFGTQVRHVRGKRSLQHPNMNVSKLEPFCLGAELPARFADPQYHECLQW